MTAAIPARVRLDQAARAAFYGHREIIRAVLLLEAAGADTGLVEEEIGDLISDAGLFAAELRRIAYDADLPSYAGKVAEEYRRSV